MALIQSPMLSPLGLPLESFVIDVGTEPGDWMYVHWAPCCPNWLLTELLDEPPTLTLAPAGMGAGAIMHVGF
jgi:hypothetical protein